MSIEARIEDARILYANGRAEGALLNTLIAVAATSRRIHPQGAKSKREPRKTMGDREAFELFLGHVFARRVLMNQEHEAGTESGLRFAFRGKKVSVEHALYKWFRCELVHEGELPIDVKFVADSPPGWVCVKATGGATGTVTISHGLIDVFQQAVIDVLRDGVG